MVSLEAFVRSIKVLFTVNVVSNIVPYAFLTGANEICSYSLADCLLIFDR